jgi:hypothetical protein
MSAYSVDEERAIRAGRLVQDWAASRLLSEEQRAAMAADLQVDLRRTNRFLRITLFLFGLLILQSFTGLLAIAFGASALVAAVLCALAAGVSYKIADLLVTHYRLYRFGIEEAAAVVSIMFVGAAGALFASELLGSSGDSVIVAALVCSAVMSLAVFLRFGYAYAAVAAMILAATVPFVPGDSDMVHRLLSIAVLVVAVVFMRRARREHGAEFPGDTYAILEATAWAGIYLITNLQISSWISTPERDSTFYWITYGACWLLPAAGLWLAIRERHRLLLDVSAIMALVTLTTNKPYLGAARQVWDPVVFGVFLIVVAVALRRFLRGGADGSRDGVVAERIVESEKERIGFVATISVAHQGPVATRPAEPPDTFGGGRSGGAGASGSY